MYQINYFNHDHRLMQSSILKLALFHIAANQNWFSFPCRALNISFRSILCLIWAAARSFRGLAKRGLGMNFVAGFEFARARSA